MRVLCALSGGVDSAVSAARLVAQGADVVAVHYRTGATAADPAAAASSRSCCGVDDARDARAVAAALGIPFYVVDVADVFLSEVVGGFVAAYAAGRTPNPCVTCNGKVKFGRLRELAAAFSAEAVATGHYARTAPRAGGGVRLLRGVDPRKDQSYVLATLRQEQLEVAVFPLGASRKEEVRAEARARGLPVADKPDSQELCFVEGGDVRAALRALAPKAARAGEVVATDGRVLGRHDGAAGFTVGQRRGVRVASAAALYVTDVDPAAGRVTVGDRAACLRDRVVVGDANWIDEPAAPAGEERTFRVEARIRHAAAPLPATLLDRGDGVLEVVFDEPAFAPAPGQLLVAYRGDAVLVAGEMGASRAPSPAATSSRPPC
jgi:tRNA-specific 2-thiouridylase